MISVHLNEIHGWIMASGVLHVKRRHRYQKKGSAASPLLMGYRPYRCSPDVNNPLVHTHPNRTRPLDSRSSVNVKELGSHVIIVQAFTRRLDLTLRTFPFQRQQLTIRKEHGSGPFQKLLQ